MVAVCCKCWRESSNNVWDWRAAPRSPISTEQWSYPLVTFCQNFETYNQSIIENKSNDKWHFGNCFVHFVLAKIRTELDRLIPFQSNGNGWAILGKTDKKKKKRWPNCKLDNQKTNFRIATKRKNIFYEERVQLQRKKEKKKYQVRRDENKSEKELSLAFVDLADHRLSLWSSHSDRQSLSMSIKRKGDAFHSFIHSMIDDWMRPCFDCLNW